MINLAGFALFGAAPLVFPALAPQDDLHRRAPIDVSAPDRLLDLAPVRFPKPAPFDPTCAAHEGAVVAGQDRARVGPLSLADSREVEPGHQPVGRDLE